MNRISCSSSRMFLPLVLLIMLTILSCRCGSRRDAIAVNVDRADTVVAASEESVAESAADSLTDSLVAKEYVRDDGAEKYDDYVEIPAPITDGRPEQILKRMSYTVSYNSEKRLPNWSAWYLMEDYTDGDFSRKIVGARFEEDMAVGMPRANYNDYKGSGYSRGHLCPSGDNKWNPIAQRQTFLMTNICPQNISLNTGFWNSLEGSSRRWAEKYGGIYIVAGPVFYDSLKVERIGENRVAVPHAFFKVILRTGDDAKAIGFVYPNAEREGGKSRIDYVCTVDEVERLTGIDFFCKLDDSLENRVESSASLDDW